MEGVISHAGLAEYLQEDIQKEIGKQVKLPAIVISTVFPSIITLSFGLKVKSSKKTTKIVNTKGGRKTIKSNLYFGLVIAVKKLKLIKDTYAVRLVTIFPGMENPGKIFFSRQSGDKALLDTFIVEAQTTLED